MSASASGSSPAAAASRGSAVKWQTLDDWSDLETVLSWLERSTDNAMIDAENTDGPTVFHINGERYTHWTLETERTRAVMTQVRPQEEEEFPDAQPLLPEDFNIDYKWTVEYPTILTFRSSVPELSVRPSERDVIDLVDHDDSDTDVDEVDDDGNRIPTQVKKLVLRWTTKTKLYDSPPPGREMLNQYDVLDKLGMGTTLIAFTQRDNYNHLEWLSDRNVTVISPSTLNAVAHTLAERGIDSDYSIILAKEAFVDARGMVVFDTANYIRRSKIIDGFRKIKFVSSDPRIGDPRGDEAGNKPYAVTYIKPPQRVSRTTRKRSRGVNTQISSSLGKVACKVCNADAAFSCAGCNDQHYCDDICQRAAWFMGHRDAC